MIKPDFVILLGLIAFRAEAGEWDFKASIAPELRLFPTPTASSNEDRLSPALSFEAEIVYDNDAGSDRFLIKPYIRLDADDGNRNLFDLREAYWLHFGEGWDLIAGINKVFWGVTESVHLVDIVNQTDTASDIDGEDKLGQPMVNATFYGNWGTLGLYAMTGFRERVFPDEDARFSAPLPIRQRDTQYDSGLERLQPDLAIRYSQFFGEIDFGISHFYGTSREPILLVKAAPSGQFLVPRYDVIHQTGIDIQLTRDATLYKFEAISRFGHGNWFPAFVAGLEHTLYQINETDADLGLLAEYQFDDRDNSAPLTIADNDLFFGARLTLNDVQDTALLGGSVVDTTNGSTSTFIEAERRLGNDWKAEIESRLFLISNDNDPSEQLRDNDLITLRFTRYF